jgi:hypothetical protein
MSTIQNAAPRIKRPGTPYRCQSDFTLSQIIQGVKFMKKHHAGSAERPLRHYTIAAIELCVAVLALTVITVVSWNLFAPALFGLPTIGGKEALGMVLLLGAVSMLLRRPHRRQRRQSVS